MSNKVTDGNRKFLSEYVARLAFQDYYAANKHNMKKRTRKDGTRPYTPYSLSYETEEARDIYAIACKADHTPEEVEIVKTFCLRAKLKRDELKYVANA